MTDITNVDPDDARYATVKALRARVKELEGLVRDGVRRAENCTEWQSRAEAAEAHVAALGGALREIQEILHVWANDTGLSAGKFMHEIMDIVTSVLAAMPADALDRATAVREFLRTVGLVTVWSVPYEWVRGDRRITCGEIGPQTMFSADREAWERLQALDKAGP